MGANCVKRQRTPVRNIRQRTSVEENNEEPFILVLNERSPNPSSSSGTSFPFLRRRSVNEDSRQLWYTRHTLSENDIDKHVLETLRILRVSAENDTNLIIRMRMFRSWANGEKGWKMILNSLIRAIPLEDPLGPSAITLFIDHCPLPTKKAVSNFISELHLSRDLNKQEHGVKTESRHRNICAVLGHLAESLASPFSKLMLTDEILEYLLSAVNAESCVSDTSSTNILFSLIALEKLSQVKDNKDRIMQTDITHRLQELECFYASDDYRKRQVGFLSQWLLDNIFLAEGRSCTYETVDVRNINAMLNDNDVSEYLKLSADGLEARSDAPSFESVRCTFSVDRGVWFYEVTVVTSGVMQIGWATKHSKFLNHDGFGIGDDEFSYAYDGCRQLCWYQAQSHPHSHPSWKEGDTLGLLLDIDNLETVFYLNGIPLPPSKNLFNIAKNGFFAAASFMSFQQCRFNFGSEPFRFPPTDREFSTFNDVAILGDSDKTILPKHLKLKALLQQRTSFREDHCTICCDNEADTTLMPCGHDGICHDCSRQISQCHLCRQTIQSRKTAEKTLDPNMA
uniref:RING finger and SPRY domain-containing protein 1-like n=1 Tax=Styela clava TaxID=7725 RepID=UPI00193AA16C|nr:RING finger and SPRY domain-containing protein 1-like [Styela clava]